MIYLTTGVPGAGKSLYTLCEVKAMAERENRQVYYDGIKDLRIPGWIDMADAGLPGADRDEPARCWMHLPPGSIIVIDECQRVFRPRGTGTAVPHYVAQLETHRHRGFDLFLVTQHPMLIDSNVRRLVGLHRHVQRAFGLHRATIHEWQNGVREQPDKSRTDSVRREFKYPVEAFGFYKSAEVHTHKRRIPPRVFFLFLAPLIIAGLLYGIYAKLRGYATGDKLKEQVAQPVAASRPIGQGPAAGGRGAAPQTVHEWLADRAPRIAGLDYTAAVYDEVTKPQAAPHPAACVKSRTRCECFTEQATRLNMPAEVCEQFVERGFFVAWQKPAVAVVAAGPAAVPARAPGPAAPESSPGPMYTTPGAAPIAGRVPVVEPMPFAPGGGPSTNPKFNPAMRNQGG